MAKSFELIEFRVKVNRRQDWVIMDFYHEISKQTTKTLITLSLISGNNDLILSTSDIQTLKLCLHNKY